MCARAYRRNASNNCSCIRECECEYRYRTRSAESCRNRVCTCSTRTHARRIYMLAVGCVVWCGVVCAGVAWRVRTFYYVFCGPPVCSWLSGANNNASVERMNDCAAAAAVARLWRGVFHCDSVCVCVKIKRNVCAMEINLRRPTPDQHRSVVACERRCKICPFSSAESQSHLATQNACSAEWLAVAFEF